MNIPHRCARWVAIALCAIGFLPVTPARALTYYQHRMAFDFDLFSYDANPADQNAAPNDWGESADLIPGNKGDLGNGPDVPLLLSDPKHGLSDIPFSVGLTTDGFNNVMLAYGQTVPLVPGKYRAIVLLYAENDGPRDQPFSLNYTDGDDAKTIRFTDWCYNQANDDFFAWKIDHVQKGNTSDTGTACGIDYKYIPVDPSRTLTSITLGDLSYYRAPGDPHDGGPNGGAELNILSLTLVSDDASLPAYGTVTGTVKDSTGNPVPTADVFVPNLGYKARGDTTGGTYSMTLPPGTYTLTAIKQGDPSPSALPVTVTVTAGKATTQNFVLSTPMANQYAEVDGTVVDGAGKPVAGATVTGSATPGIVFRKTITDATGAYSLKGLLPGAVTVTANSPQADKPISNDLTLTGGQAQTLKIVLPRVPYVSLATADLPSGLSWHLKGTGTGGTVDLRDLSPADPAYKEDGTWATDIVAPGNVGGMTGGKPYWYRLSGLILPPEIQALKGKDVPLELTGYNCRDFDETFFNGKLIGSQSFKFTIRTYAIDPNLVNWDGPNTIAVLGNAGGSAGFTNGAPILQPLPSVQSLISGNILDAVTGNPATLPANVTLTRKGASVPTDTFQGIGSYSFLNVPPGDYVVSVVPSATVSQGTSANLTSAAGKIARNDVKGTFAPFFEGTAPDPHDDAFTAALDAKWADLDLGAATPAGKASNVASHLQIDGGGTGFNRNGDTANFLYQPISGDFAATVQLLTPPGTGAAGLMLRGSVDPKDTFMAIQGTSDGVVDSPIRLATLGFTDAVEGEDAVAPPVWLKIRRVGTEVATYWSKDGQTAELTSLHNVQMSPDSVLGPYVFSNDTDTDTATFASFKVVPLTTPVPPTGVAGDLNGDGKVSIADATTALQIAVGLLTATAAQIAVGDVVGGDGKIGIPDVTKILQIAIGL